MEPMLGLGTEPRVEFRQTPGLAMPLGLVSPEGLIIPLVLARLGLTGSALLVAGNVVLLLGFGGSSLLTPVT